jgi:hypothetical protein
VEAASFRLGSSAAAPRTQITILGRLDEMLSRQVSSSGWHVSIIRLVACQNFTARAQTRLMLTRTPAESTDKALLWLRPALL